MQALYCHYFVGRHRALSLDKNCKERKQLLSSFAIKKNFNQPRDSKMDCDEDIVGCIFLPGVLSMEQISGACFYM